MQQLFVALRFNSLFTLKLLLHLLFDMRTICYTGEDDTKLSNNFNYNRSPTIAIFSYKI